MANSLSIVPNEDTEESYNALPEQAERMYINDCLRN
jgi:hypothetical protein